MTSPSPGASDPTRSATDHDPGVDSPDIDQLQAGIEQTREDLAATVDALTAKLDVKARTRAKLTDTTENVKDQAAHLAHSAQDAATDEQGQPKPAVVAGAAVAVAALVALVVRSWRRD